MPRLPSDQDLGGLPSGFSGRPIASADTSGIARGVAALGSGISALGDGIRRSDERADDLNEAKAKAAYLVGKTKLDQARDDESDPEAVAKFTPQYQSNLDQAAEYINDPTRREKFKLGYTPDVATSGVATDTRIFGLKKDAAFAETNQQLEDLKNAGLSAKDEATKANVIDTGRGLIDKLEENGFIDASEAQKRRQAWVKDYSYRALTMLPPEQRLAAVSMPAKVDDRAKEAFQFLTSKGWTPAQASGIVGNLLHESNLNTGAVNKGDGSDGSDSIGIAQWNSRRAQALKQFAAARGTSASDFKTQLEFLDLELRTSEASAGNDLLQAKTPREAAAAFLKFERPKGYEGGLGSASGGAQRAANADAVARSFGDKTASAPSPLAAVLAPDVRAQIADDADREIIQKQRQSTAQQRQEAATVNGLIKDDESSIMQTGKPVDELTPERVAAARGADEAARFVQNRQLAQRYYNETNDFDTIPSAEIGQRLQGLRPEPGKAGYENAQAFYNTAADRAQKIIRQRTSDPAEAVSSIPQVQAAAQGADLSRPESYQALAKARMNAQAAVGIPEDNRVPITKSEALALWDPIRLAPDADKKDVLSETMQQLQKAFGDDADTAMMYVLQQGHADRQTRQVTAAVIRKLSQNEPPSPDEARAFDEAQKQNAAQNAVKGIVQNEDFSDPNALLFDERFNPTPPAYTGPSPDAMDQARRALWSDPSLAPLYDQHFGKGAAEASLKQRPKNWTEHPETLPPLPKPKQRIQFGIPVQPEVQPE